jgi:hypothetical protein
LARSRGPHLAGNIPCRCWHLRFGRRRRGHAHTPAPRAGYRAPERVRPLTHAQAQMRLKFRPRGLSVHAD